MSLRHQHPWMLRNISAGLLFSGGMALLPAYLLQEDLLVRFVQVLFFGWCARRAGKRLQWVYFLTIIATITLFHLLIPSGRVLATFGTFRITRGGLEVGLFKALTVVGLVFISLASVRADLRLPGRAGALAGKIFWSFEQIMERRGQMEPRRLLASGDELLLGVYQELLSRGEVPADTGARKGTARRSSIPGHVVVFCIVAAQWGLLLGRFR
ncbi:hypothetical protein SAMN05920897_11638 [Alkalispirochaeta americana]|uniref:Cobalt transport protein n=1 Tax=Alkalispirochaeta americana TaxID=159291 RepID=A0A1N6W023_9SPIO|nr:hypothetical protein [Alkalispirochaeta americana]SIQ83459.1 hypothetical protein SAMN05920897_11638 [Alkalispirochaeta americana]